jgi:CPA2 family monovalent cation:H+ antiporter-2
MVLSESDYSHQALSDIIPLRDLFGLLFFASVGMLLDPAYLVANWQVVLFVVLMVALGKAAIFGGISRLFGYRNVTPLAVALGLFQVGEFAFVLARVGLNTGSISHDLYALTLTTTLVTMVLTPYAAQAVAPLYALRRRLKPQEPPATINVRGHELHGHVVIAGAGRVGQYVATVLQRLDLHFVVIELDQQRLEQCKKAGIPVIYGDASHPVVLTAACIQSAALVLITTPAIAMTQAIVEQVRRLQPALHIVARAEGIEQMQLLHKMGVYEVVQPQFEAGLEITRQALLHLKLPATEIERFTDAVRQELYAPLYEGRTDYQTLAQLQSAQRQLELNWVTLPAGSPLVGRTIGELHIRTRTGASIVAFMREETLTPNPGADQQLAAGDNVLMLGSQTQVAKFEELITGR